MSLNQIIDNKEDAIPADKFLNIKINDLNVSGQIKNLAGDAVLVDGIVFPQSGNQTQQELKYYSYSNAATNINMVQNSVVIGYISFDWIKLGRLVILSIRTGSPLTSTSGTGQIVAETSIASFLYPSGDISFSAPCDTTLSVGSDGQSILTGTLSDAGIFTLNFVYYPTVGGAVYGSEMGTTSISIPQRFNICYESDA